jgi:hypothetical protein
MQSPPADDDPSTDPTDPEDDERPRVATERPFRENDNPRTEEPKVDSVEDSRPDSTPDSGQDTSPGTILVTNMEI